MTAISFTIIIAVIVITSALVITVVTVIIQWLLLNIHIKIWWEPTLNMITNTAHAISESSIDSLDNMQ